MDWQLIQLEVNLHGWTANLIRSQLEWIDSSFKLGSSLHDWQLIWIRSQLACIDSSHNLGVNLYGLTSCMDWQLIQLEANLTELTAHLN